MSPDPAAPQHNVADILRDFALLLSDEHTVEDIVGRLADQCTRLLGVAGVGLLLRDGDGHLQAAASNSEIGRIVERLEAELREGPCTSSLFSGEQVAEPDLAQAHERYPRFVPRALEAGVRSIHGLPVTVRVDQIGALNIIHTEVKALTPAQLDDAQMLADVAVSYIANRRVLDASTELARQLQHALDSRVIIEQAKGKLAERHGISVNEAFERLRTFARSNRVKVHAVADEILSDDLDL